MGLSLSVANGCSFRRLSMWGGKSFNKIPAFFHGLCGEVGKYFFNDNSSGTVVLWWWYLQKSIVVMPWWHPYRSLSCWLHKVFVRHLSLNCSRCGFCIMLLEVGSWRDEQSQYENLRESLWVRQMQLPSPHPLWHQIQPLLWSVLAYSK